MAVTGGRGVHGGRGYAGTTAADLPSGSSGVGIAQREDLANFISMITRDETPFMSSIGKTKATAIYHEWQTDMLEPPGNSRIEEGTDYITPDVALSGNSVSPFGNPAQAPGNIGDKFNIVGPNRTRLGNYCQINGKTLAISGTRRVIDQAGVADEYAYQLKKRGTELRRDIEHDLIHSYNVANASGQRTMAGYQAWVNNGNTVNFVGQFEEGANPGTGRAIFSSTEGLSSDSSTALTKGALSLSDIDSVMQKIYEEGGKATKIMLSPKLRRDFSDLMVTDSGVRRNIDMDGKLRQSVDIYMSDFGDLMVVPNYIMGLSNTISVPDTDESNHFTGQQVRDFAALIYDPQWFALATLRPLQEVDVGQRGDSTIGMMVEECTFEVKNPVGCGAIYGLE